MKNTRIHLIFILPVIVLLAFGKPTAEKSIAVNNYVFLDAHDSLLMLDQLPHKQSLILINTLHKCTACYTLLTDFLYTQHHNPYNQLILNEYINDPLWRARIIREQRALSPDLQVCFAQQTNRTESQNPFAAYGFANELSVALVDHQSNTIRYFHNDDLFQSNGGRLKLKASFVKTLNDNI